MQPTFPWTSLKPGEGFFVPCLDVWKVREQGLSAALPLRIKVDAKIGIKSGVLGVWFYRKKVYLRS
jgi:hypothetical protein